MLSYAHELPHEDVTTVYSNADSTKPAKEFHRVVREQIETDDGTVVKTTVETSHVMRATPEDEYIVSEPMDEEEGTSGPGVYGHEEPSGL